MTQPNSWKSNTEEMLYERSFQQLEIINSNRMSIIQDLCLIETIEIKPHMEKMLTHLLNFDGLKSFELVIAPNSSTNPETIAKVVTTVENFELSKCTQRQPGVDRWDIGLRNNPGIDESIIPTILKEILSTNDEGKTRKLKLNIQGGYIMKNVDPALLSETAVRLHKLSIFDSGLTNEQTHEVFEAIAKSTDVKLHSLHLSNTKLSHISPHTLAEAAGKLKSVSLSGPELTVNQYNCLLRKIHDHSLNLEKLSLSNEYINTTIRYIHIYVVIKVINDILFQSTDCRWFIPQANKIEFLVFCTQ